MIEDPNTNYIGPVLFALINCKNSIGYTKLFSLIKLIINNEEIEWKPQMITIDFEDSLKKSLKSVFPDSSQIGCLFHYRQAIFRKAKEIGLFTQDLKEKTHNLLDKLINISWLPNLESFQNHYDVIKQKISLEDKILVDFLEYYEKEWITRFEKGEINYNLDDDSHRANSVLENFHSKMTENLPNFPNWQIFYEFIKNEDKIFIEETMRLELTGQLAEKSKNFCKKYEPKFCEILHSKKKE